MLAIKASNAGWKLTSRSNINELLTFHLYVSHTETSKHSLHARLWETSDPNHVDYGKHMSFNALNTLMTPSKKSRKVVQKWLSMNGINSWTTNPAQDIIEFTTDIQTAEKMLKTTFHQLEHKTITIHRSTEIHIPKDVAQYIDIVGPTTHVPQVPRTLRTSPSKSKDDAAFTTPPSIRQQYGIPSTTSSNTNSTGLAIVGFLDQYFDPKGTLKKRKEVEISVFWISTFTILVVIMLFYRFISL